MKVKNYTLNENRLITKMVKENRKIKDIAEALNKNHKAVYRVLYLRGYRYKQGKFTKVEV